MKRIYYTRINNNINNRFHLLKKYFCIEKTSNKEDIENFFKDLTSDESKTWEYYIKGINPDYEPRKEMYHFLINQNVNVKRMTVYEIECFTKWLQMRKIYGNKYPAFPYEIKFEDKIEELKEKYPLHKD
ncbi:hypothetical protein PFAG_01452 [Plasmodium falciparum Santa Lucia]|uniref:Uncharacterized protein n=15 Tax=Plasmodium falciparum TaxID=5833 RepID=C6KT61_PLAF7|nr:conserved protein, unknown function [Plasmodium falciparum 3D7]ETW19558.1 hypothetical protein PFFVO_01483 [Plasmodium falciparum Vietnam Oak-Knoll (FVO)]ETW27787.1 hypothetical protein PFFCH_04766 [Plasmodium falciparum FCH/4]ETW37787.1 hypothetical protein PFTANZ_01553 [Plasmodium falciparum Tanzania (2000708)]ETW43994.1 hypothetical protein PFNF135_01595 [Plasmodium falciparum NF135/5.C10]ETW50497.1 hypothetical protein PFMALIP_01516 [Plasmodium falciparum MaliPS096_E11]ETW53116.1 hypot|eukprot:XP_966207.1 conserved Apicomplexan protein, unknown function [Plasmodium falciparum 3D7]